MFRDKNRKPNFRLLEAVLRKETTERPVLFDFILGQNKEKLLTGNHYNDKTEFDRVITTIKAFDSGGYDFSPIIIRGLIFAGNSNSLHTKSLNENSIITDRKTFDSYVWPEISNCDFSIIDKAAWYLADGMKFVPFSYDGILENSISLIGYDNLCYLLYDDINVVEDVFENVGKRITLYFKKCLENTHVGAVILNDDWGFNTQTMLPPSILKKYVFPFYREITEYAHSLGKYTIIHSCGFYGDIIDDIIYYIRADGRHSYEDKIIPVERAYSDLKGKIAVLGGMDVDFLARSTAEDVYERCLKMLETSRSCGGYALGSGNSIPDYIPDENFVAMLKAGQEYL